MLERKTQHAVITHANTSNGMKIQTFFGKSLGMMLNLSSAPFKSISIFQLDSVNAFSFCEVFCVHHHLQAAVLCI